MVTMKQILSKYLIVVILISVPIINFAQGRSPETAFDTLNVRGQFEHLYKSSNRFEEYKVIPISGYNALKQNSLDSIQMYKQEADSHLQEISSLKNNLNNTNTEIDSLQQKLTETQQAKDSISFIGIDLSKNTYNAIMWGIVIILAAVSLILLSLYKRGHQVVKSTKARLAEVQEDLETLRKNSLVREQKLARELMDVKLKYKGRS